MTDTKTLVEIIKDSLESIAILVGGAWAYRRFVLQREAFPHIEFEVDLIFVVRQGGQWLVEVQAQIENKGKVQHKLSNFSFDLRCLTRTDAVTEGGEQINHQVNFERLVKQGSWLPAPWKWTFIEPGTRQRYSYVAALPADATCALVHGRFTYTGEREFHTADRIVRVPVDETEAKDTRAASGGASSKGASARESKDSHAA